MNIHTQPKNRNIIYVKSCTETDMWCVQFSCYQSHNSSPNNKDRIRDPWDKYWSAWCIIYFSYTHTAHLIKMVRWRYSIRVVWRHTIHELCCLRPQNVRNSFTSGHEKVIQETIQKIIDATRQATNNSYKVMHFLWRSIGNILW